MSVLSPIILMEFLLAPTVPSAPRPQNLQLMVPSGVVTRGAPISRDKFVTSSTIPSVNFCFVVFSYTATICAGVVSLEPRPKRPVNTGTSLNYTTSNYTYKMNDWATGRYKIRVTYIKDGSIDGGQDSGYIKPSTYFKEDENGETIEEDIKTKIHDGEQKP